MKILFLGLGSIGLRHAKIINRYYPKHKLYALRSSKKSQSYPFVKNLFTWKEVFKINPEVAFICSPTYLHIEDAIKCATSYMNLFIEKPISHSLKDLNHLKNIIFKNNLTCYVAYPFRHHIGFNAVKMKLKKEMQYIQSSGFICMSNIRDWGKESYSFDKNKGGGVILELSHEIDLVEFLFGKIDRLELNSKIKSKKYNIDQAANITAILENGKKIVLVLDIGSNVDSRFFYYTKKGRLQKYNYTITETIYVNQIKYFFNNLKNTKLVNNIFDASDLFEKIIATHNEDIQSYSD